MTGSSTTRRAGGSTGSPLSVDGFRYVYEGIKPDVHLASVWGGTDICACFVGGIPGVWCHGDYVERTVHGGYVIHGRSDATLNVGGVRIGTAEVYKPVEGMEEVVEALVVAQEWEGDTRSVLFVRLAAGSTLDTTLEESIRKAIREGASPRHVPARIVQVEDIPRTKSGKIVELAVREVIHGRAVLNPEAVAKPEALAHFRVRPELGV